MKNIFDYERVSIPRNRTFVKVERLKQAPRRFAANSQAYWSDGGNKALIEYQYKKPMNDSANRKIDTLHLLCYNINK